MDAFLGARVDEHRGPRGSVALWMPAPGVLVTRAEGHFHAEMAGAVVAAGNRVIEAHGTLLAFHDWQDVKTYDSETRAKLTDWGYAIRKSVERVHVLVGSKLVKMGVSVASIVLVGMLVGYDEREAFEATLREAVRERRRARVPSIPPQGE